jgi:hypothetical protein
VGEQLGWGRDVCSFEYTLGQHVPSADSEASTTLFYINGDGVEKLMTGEVDPRDMALVVGVPMDYYDSRTYNDRLCSPDNIPPPARLWDVVDVYREVYKRVT